MMLYKEQPNPPQVRQRCRNPRCGGKLKVPTDNPRDAFCCKACEARYYAVRCRVCEALFTRKTARRVVCWRSKCRYELKRHPDQYFGSRYPSGLIAHNALADPIKQGVKRGAKRGRAPRYVAGSKVAEVDFRVPLTDSRAWRVVAGPELHPVHLQIHPGSIPTSKADRAFRESIKRESAKAIFQRDTPLLNVIGGFRWPGAPTIRLAPAPATPATAPYVDGLDIPAFLKRTPEVR